LLPRVRQHQTLFAVSGEAVVLGASVLEGHLSWGVGLLSGNKFVHGAPVWGHMSGHRYTNLRGAAHSAATATELLQQLVLVCPWNSLAVQLRDPDITYILFRGRLNGHFFSGCIRTALRDLRDVAP